MRTQAHVSREIIMNKYIFIPQCSKKIIRTIDAAHTETGGYLYGYKIGHLNFITGTTVAVSDSTFRVHLSGRDAEKNITGFKKLLGVWHSHIDGNCEFTGRDLQAQRELQRIFNEMLFLLFYRNENDDTTEVKQSGCAKYYSKDF